MYKMEFSTENRVENCLFCSHFGYCLIYWGADCKRQGGHSIPRLKSTQVEKSPDFCKQAGKPTIQISESIRTKVANW